MKRAMWVTAALLVPSFALAKEPPRPLPPPSVTAFACTVETLRSGESCYFESADPNAATLVDAAAQARHNSKALRDLGEPFCKEASRRGVGKVTPPEVVKVCVQQFDVISADCGLEGAVAVLDPGGRFNPRARECYQELARVLSEARTGAMLAPDCCECLTQSKCSNVKPAECTLQLSRGRASSDWQTCMADSCSAACMAYVEPRPKTEASTKVQPEHKREIPRKDTRL